MTERMIINLIWAGVVLLSVALVCVAAYFTTKAAVRETYDQEDDQ